MLGIVSHSHFCFMVLAYSFGIFPLKIEDLHYKVTRIFQDALHHNGVRPEISSQHDTFNIPFHC